MEKVVFLAVIITVLFFFAKMIEMEYIEKELKPLKYIVRDTIVVFLASFVPIYTYFSLNGPISEILGVQDSNMTPTQVFTDTPGF